MLILSHYRLLAINFDVKQFKKLYNKTQFKVNTLNFFKFNFINIITNIADSHFCI